MPLIFLPIKHIFHLLYMLLHHDLNLNSHITYWTFFFPHYTHTGSSHYMFKKQIRARQLYLQHMDKFQTVIMQTYGVKCSMTRGYFCTTSGFIQAREVTHSAVMWNCFTDYLVPKILRQHNGPIFNPLCCLNIRVLISNVATSSWKSWHTHTHTHCYKNVKTHVGQRTLVYLSFCACSFIAVWTVTVKIPREKDDHLAARWQSP